MNLKNLAFLLCSALAVAKTADNNTSASLTITVPSDIVSGFYSALPTSDQAKITDLAGAEEVLSDYASSTAWWSSLPSNVRSFATSVVALDSSLAANAASSSSLITSSASTNNSTATTTITRGSSGSSSDAASTSGSDSTSDSTSDSSSTGASSSSSTPTESSTAGAPAATGNIAFGVAGVAGVLGVALVL